MQISDDLFLGNFSLGSGLLPSRSDSADPTVNQGVGPAGRLFFLNILPLTVQTANVAVLQALTASTALTLAAGTGVTASTAPDGSGSAVILFDTARAVSLTSTANLSAINFTITGFDIYGRKITQTRAGPNNNTVNTLKAFMSVLSVVPASSSVSTLSVGTSDIYGMPWRVFDKTYLVSVLWANSFAVDTGTFVIADDTSPATAATGDTRGTYVPSSASNGSRRLVIAMHLDVNQCGKSATVANAIGVTPA